MRSSSRLLLTAFVLSAASLVFAEAALAWQCTARSRTASGWAISSSRATASRNALMQCAYRTPRGLMCRITSCRR